MKLTKHDSDYNLIYLIINNIFYIFLIVSLYSCSFVTQEVLMSAIEDETNWKTSQLPPFHSWSTNFDWSALIYKQDAFIVRISREIEVLPNWPLVGPTLSIGPPFLPIIPYWRREQSDYLSKLPILIYLEFFSHHDSGYFDLSELEIITNSHGTFKPFKINRALDSTEWVYSLDTIKTGSHKFETFYHVKNDIDYAVSPQVNLSLPRKYFEILFSLSRDIVVDSIESFKIVFPEINTRTKCYSIPSLEFVKKSRYKYYALYMD